MLEKFTKLYRASLAFTTSHTFNEPFKRRHRCVHAHLERNFPILKKTKMHCEKNVQENQTRFMHNMKSTRYSA